MTLGEAIEAVSVTLARAGVEQPRREARLLAGHLLGASAGAWLDPARDVDGAALATLAARRAGREPLAFITGRHGFWTLELEVSSDTLIPRADSETLIEAALEALPGRRNVRRILDLGTGTGCLLLAALAEFADAFGVGVDLSVRAAALARRNAASNGLDARSAFLAGDWGHCLDGRFDLILSNPPYVATGDLAGLAPELRYEPRRALDGGASGLDAYGLITPDLPRLLNRGGVAIFEVGAGQARDVARLAQCAGLLHRTARRDFGGIERALILELP